MKIQRNLLALILAIWNVSFGGIRREYGKIMCPNCGRWQLPSEKRQGWLCIHP